MEFTPLDCILIAVIAFFGGWGAWRGIAGEIAAVAWILAALSVGYFSYSGICSAVATVSSSSGGAATAAAVGITVLVALVAALLVRFIVRKFVSVLLPQPWNAVIGGLVGVLKGAALVAALTAVGLVQTGPLADGFFASKSALVRMLAKAADSYKTGAEGAE